jgi:hypothetical protein
MKVSGQLQGPAALPRRNRPRYPLDGRVGGPRSRSGRCGEEENLAPVGIRTPAVQSVTRRYTDSPIPTLMTEGKERN